MNRGRLLALAAVVAASVAVVSGGCQSYNYNPVGVCVIQPGTQQVKLSDVSTADLLFVVDDSGSMDPKQQALADNFSVFIAKLTTFNEERVANGLVPFDFHIAVTTSSVFRDYTVDPASSLATTTNRCIASGAGKQCCNIQPTTCVADAACTEASAGASCGTAKACVWNGQATTTNKYQCCGFLGTTCQAVGTGASIAGCLSGGLCGIYSQSYEPQLVGCQAGVASPGGAYPAGDFVRAGSNPRVLHFTKDLYTPTVNVAAIAALSAQFQQNIKVGSCGSGEEQHLQAARLAIQKALAGQQPGVAASEWPHPGAKMVVVAVADEDDCSNPADPSSSIVLVGDPGVDSCTNDQNPVGRPYQYTEADYEAFFVGLGRPFGLATIASAVEGSCQSGKCEPGICSVGGQPYGYGPGRRLFGVTEGMRALGYDVVEGSVCQPFGELLAQIADLVKAPSALKLETVPAASQMTVLRIIDTSGVQRKVCTQALVDAERESAGWWFVDCSNTVTFPPVAPGPTQCIHVNQQFRTCEANPGETYSAEYLGQMPPGGCSPASGTSVQAPSAQCATALGSSGGRVDPADWWCYGPQGGVGTCVCATGQ